MNKILEFIIGTGAELLTLKDPFPEPYQRPEITGTHTDYKGDTVYEVYAQNHVDATKPFEGTTPEGGYRVATHVGRNRWEISTRDY